MHDSDVQDIAKLMDLIALIERTMNVDKPVAVELAKVRVAMRLEPAIVGLRAELATLTDAVYRVERTFAYPLTIAKPA